MTTPWKSQNKSKKKKQQVRKSTRTRQRSLKGKEHLQYVQNTEEEHLLEIPPPATTTAITPTSVALTAATTTTATTPIPSAITPSSITVDTPLMDRDHPPRLRCPGSLRRDLAEAALVINKTEEHNILHHIFNMHQSEGQYGNDVFDFLFNNNNNNNIDNNNNLIDNIDNNNQPYRQQ